MWLFREQNEPTDKQKIAFYRNNYLRELKENTRIKQEFLFQRKQLNDLAVKYKELELKFDQNTLPFLGTID